jgi:hypothetical protein
MFARRFPLFLVAAGLLSLAGVAFLPAPAVALGFGVRGGASIDPDQFVFGGHLDVLEKPGLLRPVLPIVEVGVGDNQTTVSVLADLLLKPDLRLSRWSLMGGLEGGLRYINPDGSDDLTKFAWLLVFGMERERLGFQLKLNLANAADVELLATYGFGK